MVSIAAYVPGDPVSNPSWFAVSNSNKNWAFNTQIIQAYNRVMQIVITMTVSSHVSVDKNPLKLYY